MARKINAGDWIVVGGRRDQLDYGRVYESDDGTLWVAWFGGGEDRSTPLDLDPVWPEVFTSRGDARSAYNERLEMYPQVED